MLDDAGDGLVRMPPKQCSMFFLIEQNLGETRNWWIQKKPDQRVSEGGLYHMHTTVALWKVVLWFYVQVWKSVKK